MSWTQVDTSPEWERTLTQEKAIEALKKILGLRQRIYCVQLKHPKNSLTRIFRVFANELTYEDSKLAYEVRLCDIASFVSFATGLKWKDGTIVGKHLTPHDIATAIHHHVYNDDPAVRVESERV